MYRCLNGAAPRYLTELATPVGGTARRRLRSASSTDLVVPVTRRSTIGDRSFAVASPRAWISLYLLLSAPLPHTTSWKRPQISHFWTIILIVTIVYLTMYSALVVVYTAYCALQIVLLTLHYITLPVCCWIQRDTCCRGTGNMLPATSNMLLGNMLLATGKMLLVRAACCRATRCPGVNAALLMPATSVCYNDWTKNSKINRQKHDLFLVFPYICYSQCVKSAFSGNGSIFQSFQFHEMTVSLGHFA